MLDFLLSKNSIQKEMLDYYSNNLLFKALLEISIFKKKIEFLGIRNNCQIHILLLLLSVLTLVIFSDLSIPIYVKHF